MNELLKFMIEHWSFLYEEMGFRFVDSLTQSGDALLTLQRDSIRLQLIRDRGQIFVKIQYAHKHMRKEWFSICLIEQFITNVCIESDVIDEIKAETLREYMPKIEELFSPKNHVETERKLHHLKWERAKRYFG